MTIAAATGLPPEDPDRPDLVAGLQGVLATFNQAGVLSAADVHTAVRLARLVGEEDPLAILGAAFAVRAPRFGHVHADLAGLADAVTDEDGRIVPLPAEAWPDLDAWMEALGRSTLVATDGRDAPLHLVGTSVYLDRYLRHERRVAARLLDRVGAGASAAPLLDNDGAAALEEALSGEVEQLDAGRAALQTRLAVIAGGPGTGKTRTVARLVRVAVTHGRRDGRPVRIAIAAPTGKAAARLGEALRQDVAPASDGAPGHRSPMPAPTTLHRLLGSTRSRTTFRHNRGNPLPHDLVIVDEVSMVSLSMLARLLDALDPATGLVLVGDPDQLAAVEAGSVLGDIISAADGTPLSAQVVTLTRNHRSGAAITDLADAVRRGDTEAALAALVRDPDDPVTAEVSLVTPPGAGRWPARAGALTPVADLLTGRARDALSHADAGDAGAALEATMSAKVLCAHRRGTDGVTAWNAAVEGWVLDLPSYRRPEWYAGRPVMATGNDASLDLYNGDVGVVIRDGDILRVAIDGRNGTPIDHRRIGDVMTVHAMTVHKSQGSQFADVVVVLPEDRSPILTRELLYTAITRASRSVTIVGTPDALAHGITRQVSRASGLPDLLRA